MKVFCTFTIIFVFFALNGCAGPEKPKLAASMSMPAIPSDQEELIQVDIKFESESKLEDNAVQLASHTIKPNSSIVINVPSGLFEEQSNKNAKSQDFKTKDFFNEAEQQIEKVLIRKGFRVLSRSKFEAKLRSLRDESRCNINEYRCLHSQVSPEVQPILEDLKNQYDEREISALQYSEQIKLFKDKLQTASAGRRRTGNEKELTDISEVIRAAESGDIQADYILQINVFDTAKEAMISQDLRHNAAVREFMRKHAEIKTEFERNNNNRISCAVVGAHLNAKLVHVKTGEIAWIGEHQLDELSAGVQEVAIELGNRKYVSNTKDIRTFVTAQNTQRARQNRYGRTVSFPAFEYTDALIKPTISSGRCEQSWHITREMRVRLARQVAKDLINTIKIH